MKTKVILTTATLLFAGNLAMADAFTDKIVADLQSNGYDRIEIKVGPSQTKAEAINGNRKIEVVYDNATGSIIKQEHESAAGESISQGVDVRREDRDFERRGDDRSDDNSMDSADDDDDHGSDDHGSGHDSNDDDGNDDDGSDDHGGDDHGDDDDGDDDHGGDDHGDDDDRGDDHGGSGSGKDDD